MKHRLKLYLERIEDLNPDVQKLAIESLRQEICTLTSSMSTVPKPLKLLHPHYGTLKSCYEVMADSELKKYLADILSVVAWTICAKGEQECLKYRLLGSEGDIGSWGHGYVRNLADEISEEFEKPEIEVSPISDLMTLVGQIVAFLMKSNAEPEAVDFLIKVRCLEMLLDHVESTNYKRTCLHLASATRYLNVDVLDIACTICEIFGDYTSALRFILFQDDAEKLKEMFTSFEDPLQKKQCCYILARQGVTLELDDEMVPNENDRKVSQDIINNVKLSEGYLTLARDIDCMEPKSHKEICNVHLAFDCRSTADIASMHVAATFMNAFVNAGFGQDKLMTSGSESTRSWLFRNKKHRKTSVAASLGLILLWDVDVGLAQIDKYFDSNDNHVIAGALLAVGIITCGIKDDSDPFLDLLANYIKEEDASIRIGAIMGLGLAYAGSQNGRIHSLLSPILEDLTAPLDVLAFTAISLGLVFVGSGNRKVANSIMSSITMDRSEAELSNPLIRFLPLGVGLVYLGKKDSFEETAQSTNAFHKKLRKCFYLTLLSLAYAGTRDVEKVQNLLAYFVALTKDGGDTHQGTAVIGIALVAMAEEVGLDMAIQSLKGLLKYEEQNIRRAVPLSLALLCISNPKVNVMDTLSGLSHDTDSEVAMCAIISLGLIGAGTNNSQIASMLQGLAKYYSKEGNLLFCVRIAQGLLHLGKGLLTLSPYHSNHLLLSPTILAGIITMLCACLDMKSIILGDYPYVLYFLVLAMQPRMLMTLDENLEPLAVPVRVGQPVWTYSTPVVLAAECAELSTENISDCRYIPLSPVLEGFVILKENPRHLEEH
ncbi:26S proteasome non-ATPase regulatory subunit 2 A [Cinnamomum micranthum f. kanehirae]|uniref:26S proteasome non-ATPase regulatory subunit 2 homolog n=1 Tax=Cinnamomum micranthum f. kanehirae TaxID=337451 RepID=A0A3S3Q8A7_9MAGN|nr:26S proteasome non-ATPase regulatory subunit 2 A [Cinnamomum micranthum f. kanehirae]